MVSRENDVVRSQLSRNRVTVLSGTASFLGPHEIEVDDGDGRDRKVTADSVVIATGTKPARPASVAFDEKTIIDSDGIQHLKKVPRTMVVAGAGVIGIEYASMFAALGCKVTVVEQRDRMLEFCDLEVVEALKFHLRDLAVTFRFGEIVDSVEAKGDGRDRHPAQREADPRRHRDVLRGPAGHDPRAEPARGGAGGRQAAAGSRSTSSTGPRSRTSTRSAT